MLGTPKPLSKKNWQRGFNTTFNLDPTTYQLWITMNAPTYHWMFLNPQPCVTSIQTAFELASPSTRIWNSSKFMHSNIFMDTIFKFLWQFKCPNKPTRPPSSSTFYRYFLSNGSDWTQESFHKQLPSLLREANTSKLWLHCWTNHANATTDHPNNTLTFHPPMAQNKQPDNLNPTQ